MQGHPQRYFPGQRPQADLSQSDESDTDDDVRPSIPREEIKPSGKELSHSVRRRRIQARVITSHQDHPPQSSAPTSVSYSSFVPVNQLGPAVELGPTQGNQTATLPAASDYSSSDQYSSDSPALSDDPGETLHSTDGEPHITEPPLRPVFMKPDLQAISQKRRVEEHRLHRQEEQNRLLRIHEAKRLVSQVLKEEQRNRDPALGETDVLPDDEDHPEFHDADFALWKVREILRIRRDRDEALAWQNRTSIPLSARNDET